MRFFRYFVIFVLVISCLTITCFASVPTFPWLIGFTKESTVINSIGDSETLYTINPLFDRTFQLWTTIDPDTWGDYLGFFNNSSDPIYSNGHISGRVRPFGQSVDLNIGSNVGDVINSGYCFTGKEMNYSERVRFTFGFDVIDINKTGTLPPSSFPVKGNLYLFNIDENGMITNKSTRVISFNYTYDESLFRGYYRAEVEISYFDLFRGNSNAFIPLFTFRNVDLLTTAAQVYIPIFQFEQYFSFQQKLLNDLDSLINGSLSPENFDPDNIISGGKDLVSGLDDFVASRSDSFSVIAEDSVDVLKKYSLSMASVSSFINLLTDIEVISHICYISISIGALGVLLSFAQQAINKRRK